MLAEIASMSFFIVKEIIDDHIVSAVSIPVRTTTRYIKKPAQFVLNDGAGLYLY